VAILAGNCHTVQGTAAGTELALLAIMKLSRRTQKMLNKQKRWWHENWKQKAEAGMYKGHSSVQWTLSQIVP